MTREAKMRRAKLVTLLNLLSGALVFSYVWGLLGPGLGVTFLIGLAICAAGLFHRWGIARSGLSFGTLGALLLCLYYYLFSDPRPGRHRSLLRNAGHGSPAGGSQYALSVLLEAGMVRVRSTLEQ